MITLESSFTEDFSNPEVVVTSQDWRFYFPDGSQGAYDNVVGLKQLTVLEQALSAEGTYRFSTGERLGRKGRMYQMPDGELKSVFNEKREELPKPEGATVVTTQTATVADVYDTKGAPTATVLDTRIGRLRIEPVTHPNEIYLDEGFSFRLTFDGEALSGHEMTLYRDGGAYASDKGKRDIKTGEDDVTTITFDKPGMYLLMTRFRASAPDGAETDIRSYTTSLTFEVTP
jgi:plastocyanin